ncbi:acyltransferase [Phyllobacterium sp. LjRoot231]|uniref:acyltransferase n=1 Tax=Phyllobacterium sp. LjRoot231 TaxID=3342289 RepID=UPI003ECCC844
MAVLIIHASEPALDAAPWSLDWTVGMVLDQIVDFAVPLFLALSGYFARYEEGEKPLHYYAHRFSRLIGPYLIWTLIYIAVLRPEDLVSPRHFLIAVGAGTGIGYFVIVLCQFIILTPLLARIRNERTHLLLMTGTALIGLTYSYVVRFIPDSGPFGQFPAYALPFFVWCPFYQMGFYLARFPKRAEALARHTPVLAMAAGLFLCLSIAEGFWLGELGEVSFGASQIKLTSFGFSAALFAWLVARAQRLTLRDRLFAWLGRNSYPIYLMHMLVLRTFNRLLVRLPALHDLMLHHLVLLRVAISAVAVLAICSAIIWCGQQIPQRPVRRALAM